MQFYNLSRVPWFLAELCGVCHAHGHGNNKKWKTYFFKLLISNFTDLHPTLHVASVDPLDKKNIKRILIFQRILKLLKNNFLYILVKTRSVAYLDKITSNYHNTFVRAILRKVFCLNYYFVRILLWDTKICVFMKEDISFHYCVGYVFNHSGECA